MVYGPPIHFPASLDQLNESNLGLWKIISSGREADVPDAYVPLYVDVRDVAMAHVLALENPKAENQRYAISAAQYSNQEVGPLGNCSDKVGCRLDSCEISRKRFRAK